MAADAAAGSDRFLENWIVSLGAGGCFYFGGELVDQRVERHYLARREISLEQIARIFAFHLGTKKIRRTFRVGDEHRRCKDAEEVLTQRMAPSAARSK